MINIKHTERKKTVTIVPTTTRKRTVFELTGKVRNFRENAGKLRFFYTKILEKFLTFRQFLFLLVNFNLSVLRIEQKIVEMEKYWKILGNLSVRRCGNHGQLNPLVKDLTV